MSISKEGPGQGANSTARHRPSVLAMVLTHNLPDDLGRSLRDLAGQTRRPEGLLVVDNASSPPASAVVDAWTPPQDLDVQLVREPENTGPGGGWARALDLFRTSDYDLGWLLDDDIVPRPDALELLLEEAGDLASAYVIPAVRHPSGAVTTYPGWDGVLVSRHIVEHAGLPRADFFWWTEDAEYLMWRIPGEGFPLRFSRRVVVEHLKGRGQWGNPPWKYYYEARNSVYFHFHLRGGRGRWPRKLVGLTARAVLKEHERRGLRLAMIARGVIDGALGRLGRRVDPANR